MYVIGILYYQVIERTLMCQIVEFKSLGSNLKLVFLEPGFLVIRADLIFPENYMEDIRTSGVVTWFFYMMKPTLNLNNMINTILKLLRSELYNF